MCQDRRILFAGLPGPGLREGARAEEAPEAEPEDLGAGLLRTPKLVIGGPKAVSNCGGLFPGCIEADFLQPKKNSANQSMS